MQRPWSGAEELAKYSKLIPEYLLGFEYDISRLLLGSGSPSEMTLTLGYLAMSVEILLNTNNPQKSIPINCYSSPNIDVKGEKN